jgi:hypothetical protein
MSAATPRRLPIYQDLYLIAHDEAGKPLIHLSSMGLGLAGAALIELALGERVAVTQGRGAPSERARIRTGDAVLDGLLLLVTRNDDHDVRSWIKGAAKDIYSHTRKSLVSSGVLIPVTKRRMGMLPYTRYQLADIASVVRASAGVRSAAEGWKQPDSRSAALCGLVAVLRVEEALYIDQPSSQLIARLRAIAGEHSPVVKELVDIVDHLVGEAAVAVYR